MSESIVDGVRAGLNRWIGTLLLVIVFVVLACSAAAVVWAPGCRGTPASADAAPTARAHGGGKVRADRGGSDVGTTTVEVDGKRVVAPAGSRISVVSEEIGEDREVASNAEGHGDDPTASATEKAAKSGGGETDYAGLAGLIDAAKAGDPKYLSIVLVGALLVAGGLVVLLWLGRKALGLGLIAGGGAMVALGVVADASPWVFAAVVIVALIGVVLVVAHARLARAEAAALGAIVPAVEKADPSSTNGIKSEIERNAGSAISAVRAAVRRVKAKVGVASK